MLPTNFFKVLLASLIATGSVTSLVIASLGKPNIVVFLVDDMGVMDTSVPFLTDKDGNLQSHPLNIWYRTPHMERLAAQGIRFSTFYAQSVCSPTRVSIMTGQNATRHGTTTWINPSSNNRGEFGPKDWNWMGVRVTDVTLPKLLSKAGYQTIHVGKGHFGPMGHKGETPLNLGFNTNVAGACWGRPKSYYGEDHYGNHPKYTGRTRTHNIPHLEKYHGTNTFLSEALTLEANAQLDLAVRQKKPFFLYLSHYAAHSPFHSDPRFEDHYKNSDKPKSAGAFATLIEGMDKSLGDILDHLSQLGVAEDTLVIFLGDNGSDAPLGKSWGYSSSAPLRGKKGTCYEGGMRVPFIAAWAKPDKNNRWQKKLPIPRGELQSQLGTVMDIFPTVLALTGVKNPASHAVDGFDLTTQLKGDTNKSRSENFLMHFPHPHRSSYFTSFRTGDWKLIYHYNTRAREKSHHELFNLKADPFEKTNLAGENPAKLQKMIQAMTRQLEAERGLYPTNKNGRELKPRTR